ncbi:uncharacterized protein LOC125036871 [Penaeus chinensis]|uniref:uncharacterized protein LOC125036871 n=1 Tax=Penaeus chinensis TaxID=139456 RepID=UPI001FB77137|nr:uncharacterized protein LOC125036871 [Penaeus chinensis]XP_047485741.1 uncharacterized protein LOC125036871 [Penaeus chinensis]XP_047485742.1 uncharacterized protein LOC125036871 [Penaeus chinensis]XP_047485743.1 uncharacterized protein LOC125036871 [Penaeus chinensis]
MGLVVINTGYLKTKSGIMKIIEIVCVVCAFGLLRGSSRVCGHTTDSHYLGVGVLVAALMVTPLLLISYMMGKMQIQNTFLEIALNALFSLFLLAVGADALRAVGTAYTNHYNRKCFAMGIFSIAACITYLLDTVFCVMVYRGNN